MIDASLPNHVLTQALGTDEYVSQLRGKRKNFMVKNCFKYQNIQKDKKESHIDDKIETQNVRMKIGVFPRYFVSMFSVRN